MLTLLKNGELFNPTYCGKRDVLLANEKILSIAGVIDVPSTLPCRVIHADGKKIVPGFIDGHVHIIGGGGEGSYRTRTPELTLRQAIEAGVTSLVGLIGTDGTTRTMTELIAKAKALKEEGISCFVLLGSYQLPINTLTGSIQRDFLLIDEIIGLGEIAISDHRSSQPSTNEIMRIAAEARVGGMLSGKAGVVTIHLGDGNQGLKQLQDIAEKSDLPITQFVPTHINRNERLFWGGIHYAKQGGYVDLTTSTIPRFLEEGEVKCSKGLRIMLSENVPLEQITFTSDAQGSLPNFNERGELVGLKIGEMDSLFKEVRDAVIDEAVPLEQALHVITKNPATILKLKHKGEVKEGYDADLVLLDKDLLIDTVIARGRVMVDQKKTVVKGMFEQ